MVLEEKCGKWRSQMSVCESVHVQDAAARPQGVKTSEQLMLPFCCQPVWVIYSFLSSDYLPPVSRSSPLLHHNTHFTHTDAHPPIWVWLTGVCQCALCHDKEPRRWKAQGERSPAIKKPITCFCVCVLGQRVPESRTEIKT